MLMVLQGVRAREQAAVPCAKLGGVDADEEVAYRSMADPSLLILGASAVTILCVVFAVAVLVQPYVGSRWGSIPIFLVGCIAFFWWLALSHCYEAVLRPNGELEFFYLLRHRLTSARAVRQVSMERGSDGERWFVITFADIATVRLANSRYTREFVDALLTRYPSITTDGYGASA